MVKTTSNDDQLDATRNLRRTLTFDYTVKGHNSSQEFSYSSNKSSAYFFVLLIKRRTTITKRKYRTEEKVSLKTQCLVFIYDYVPKSIKTEGGGLLPVDPHHYDIMIVHFDCKDIL
uniref:Uncharacterized protein n=1 Tax=Caenorhabditis tropicalis TaxID=1561998 RepID=A0A1I7V338_9PELO